MHFGGREPLAKDGGGNWHSWSIRGKLGLPVAWETELVTDLPGRIVSWRSVENSAIRSCGRIRFTKKKGGRGTKIHLEMTHVAADGFSGGAFNRAMGSLVRWNSKRSHDCERGTPGGVRHFVAPGIHGVWNLS
jgi:uncharacterized membrane protein